MTLQMLPIAQIGCMLSSNQWTEELPHNVDEGKADATPYTPFLPPNDHHYLSFATDTKALAYIHTSARIPSNHSTDVVSPPPDVTAA
jgi:hypothetical protein